MKQKIINNNEYHNEILIESTVISNGCINKINKLYQFPIPYEVDMFCFTSVAGSVKGDDTSDGFKIELANELLKDRSESKEVIGDEQENVEE